MILKGLYMAKVDVVVRRIDEVFVEIECEQGISAELSDFLDRKSTRLNSSHIPLSRMPSSA